MEFLKEVLAQSAVTAALLAALAFLLKKQIAHWLNKDLERLKSAYAQELEDVKSRNAMQLENHRVGLIAAAETAKSAAEIKKSGALFILERHLESLMKLYRTVDSVDTKILARCTIENKTHETSVETFGIVDTLKEAISDAQPFLENHTNEKLNEYKKLAYSVALGHCSPGTSSVSDELKASLLSASLNAKTDLIELIKKLSAI